jgi:tetratricopeptide (TPR) repeat protein
VYSPRGFAWSWSGSTTPRPWVDSVRSDPDDLDARRALALEEHAIGDNAGADRDIELCLRDRPDDPLAWRTRLEILQDRGDVDAMHEVVARLPSITETDARVWYYRGLDVQRAGDQAGAVEAFRRAAKLALTDPEILYKLGMTETALGQVEAGRAHLARSRQLRQAFGDLRDHYHSFLEQSRRTPLDPEAYRSAVERIAATCRTFAWSREADAWLAVASAK